MSDDGTAIIRIACRVCSGAGGYNLEGLPERQGYKTVLNFYWTTCSACRGTGVAAERVVPACAEPFPLARPEDD